jgi:ubiquinone/menaquinone biosynthesis C-methylase UbiE
VWPLFARRIEMADPSSFKETVADVFSRAATTYDQVGTRFFSYFGQKLVEYADVPSGARVLDVATGRGASLFPAAEKVGPSGEVIGIDLTAEMVEQTGNEIKARGITNARTLRMDAENLDFPDNSFDRVICGFAIFFMPDAQGVLSEFKRVLKPGGVLALSTWSHDDDGRWAWDAELKKKYVPPRPAEMQINSGGYSHTDFDTSEGISALVSGAGFENVQVSVEELEFAYKDADEWWATRWSHFSRYDMERMTSEDLEKYKIEAFAKMREMAEPDGVHRVERALFTRGVKRS